MDSFIFEEPEPKKPEPKRSIIVRWVEAASESFIGKRIQYAHRESTEPQQDAQPDWRPWAFCLWVGFCLLVTFAFTIGCQPSLLVPLHYASLWLAVFLIAAWGQRKLPDHWYFQKTAGVFACVVVFMWGRYFDYYEARWSRPVDQGGAEFFDWTHRASMNVVHRRIVKRTANGNWAWTMSGPMAGDPRKPHGHWTNVDFDPTSFHDEWFWYGEKISQGEWELRNKR